jgi:meso-butanediol dehydrogenase / (S,S)-butanediol dehydrogenase / diacetyl reductase
MSRVQRTTEHARGEPLASASAPTPVALVTGAGGGIGGAVTSALAGAGYAVLAVDRDVSAVASAPAGHDPRAVVAHRADLVRDDEAAGAVAAVVDRFGRLDVLVCAHGGSGRRFGDGPVDECNEEAWHATLELNLTSVFLVCRHAVPALRAAGGGAIVTVSSVLGLVGGGPDFATHAYAASKGAVIALTRSMAVTYAAEGIRCNVVCPGLIATPMSARAQADDTIRARLRHLQPLTGDLGAPEDVAEAVVYLAGARFVTGTVLTVDGGWTAQ